MVMQYPHTLITTSINVNAIQDEQGNWLQSDEETTLLLPCRAESNSYRFITLQDGSQYVFPFTVYMPLNIADIPVDAQIEIRDISQQVAGYTAIETEPIAITITEEMAGSNSVAFAGLKGKTFRLERRGLGTYSKSEYTYLPDGGFSLNDGSTIEAGEMFFAYVTGNYVPDDIASARLVASGTVKQFSRGQLNCRVWL